MNKLVLLGAIAAAGFAPAAMAQSLDTDTAQVTVIGNVAKLCVLGTPSSSLIDLAQMAETSGTRVGRIKTIADQTVTMPGSFCNFARSKVTVDASALVADDATAAQPGFARAVNFTATASNWAATDAAATTAADRTGALPLSTGTGSTQLLPKLADISLTLSGFSVPGDLLMVSGGYTGSVIVTLGPDAAL